MRVVPSARGVAAIVLAAAAMLGACSDSPKSTSGDSAQEDRSGGGGAGGSEALTAGAGLPERGGQPADAESVIVYTGSLTVRVDDRSKAADQVIAIAEDRGGRLFSQKADMSTDAETTLVVKVAPDEFSGAMDDLADLGDPQRRQVDSEDVTDDVVDLEGRLETATRSAERLRELLVDAVDVDAIVAVEQELVRRESEIESLQGQLRVLESQTEQATITITLTTEDEPSVNKDIPGFGTGLSNGVVALVNFLAVVFTVFGFLLPFLALLVPFVVAWKMWRKRHPKAAKRASSGPAPTMVWDGVQWRTVGQATTGSRPDPGGQSPTASPPATSESDPADPADPAGPAGPAGPGPGNG